MSDSTVDGLFEDGQEELENGDYGFAAAIFGELIERCPDMEGAWGNRGYALYEIGEDREALCDFDTVIELNPQDAWGHGFRALVLRNLGRHAEALEAAATAIELAEEDEVVGPAHLVRGWLFACAGQFAAACEDLEIYLESGGDGCVETLYNICRHVRDTGSRSCETGPGGALRCSECLCSACGYSFYTGANAHWEEAGGRCPFSHCVMTMPHRNGEGPGICPVFGHDCPGGAEVVKVCAVEPEEEEDYHPDGEYTAEDGEFPEWDGDDGDFLPF